MMSAAAENILKVERSGIKVKTMEKEKVTVVVIVYNVVNFLRQCLDSVVNQTYRKLQIVVVDDGSSDGSEKICDEYAKADERIEVVHKKNEGISAARNTAIDISTGEYIFFVDSDDFLELCVIEKMLDIAEKTKADIVNCSINVVDEAGNYEASKYITENKQPVIMKEREFWNKCESEIVAVVAWSKLYHRRIWKKNRYRVGKIHEDEGALKDILSVCNYIACTDFIGYNYRIRKNSVVREQFGLKNLDKSEFLAERLEYFVSKKYKEYYMTTFGEGARILVKAYTVLDFKGDKEVREKINMQYLLYKKYAKYILPYVSFKEKIQLRIFSLSLKLYRNVRNIISKYKI